MVFLSLRKGLRKKGKTAMPGVDGKRRGMFKWKFVFVDQRQGGKKEIHQDREVQFPNRGEPSKVAWERRKKRKALSTANENPKKRKGKGNKELHTGKNRGGGSA